MRRRRRPDPEVRRLLLQLSMAPSGAPGQMTVDEVRRIWQLSVKAFSTRERVASVTETSISGPGGPIRLRAYRPHARGITPCLVWFHGGGFVFGDLYTAGASCRALANRTGATVIAVDYRLAPEHPLEDGRTDCLAATQWIAEHAAKLRIDPGRIAVGGDSAGGGIAALVAQECHRTGLSLRAQLLVYPATDMTASYPSATEKMPGILSAEWTAWLRSLIATVSDLEDPASSALRSGPLENLPPTIAVTAGFDPLCDEGFAYVSGLRSAGVPVVHDHYPGQIHGFFSFDAVLNAAREALDRVGSALDSAFHGNLREGYDDDLPRVRLWGTAWMAPRQRRRELAVAATFLMERLADRGGRRRYRATPGAGDNSKTV